MILSLFEYSDYTNLASRFTLTVGDNTDTAFTLSSSANDTLTFTIDSEDFVQTMSKPISITYNAGGTAVDLSDAADQYVAEDARLHSGCGERSYPTDSFNNGEETYGRGQEIELKLREAPKSNRSRLLFWITTQLASRFVYADCG